MYVESIVSISETEERVRRMKAEAEIAILSKESDEKAMAAAKDLAHSGDNKKAVMRARAEKRMDEAVALIVERIVKA